MVLRLLNRAGFTLPSVMIVSVAMFGVLALAMQQLSVTTESLKNVHYSKVAREAVESGVAHAQECLESNGYVASWTAAKPLMPHTDCSGNSVSSQASYVLSTSSARSYYKVGVPVSSGGAQRVIVTATVDLLQSGGAVWSSHTQVGASNVGATLSFNNVVFGYVASSGSFFSVLYPNGQVMSTGYNGNGQHGNGSYTSSATPSVFGLPIGERAIGVYTSFLSNGSNIFVATDKGNLYGAGGGGYGQLGDAAFTNRTTPVRFRLPTNVSPKSVSMLQNTTFVTASDGNIYAAGSCGYGVLGNGLAISGCSSVSTPARVRLPTPVTSNLNTLPGTSQDDIVSDANTVFVRMQGGAVYGWGRNNRGQFGNGTTTDSSTPVRVGTFGNSGQPSITQISFDGDTLYMLDNSGAVWVTGSNFSGALAGAASRIRGYGSNGSDGLCLDSTGVASGAQLKMTACSNAAGQRFEWVPINPKDINTANPYGFRGLIKASSGLCVKNRGATTVAGNVNANPIELAACVDTNAQHLWEYRENGRSIFWSSSGSRCLDKSSANMAQLWDCNGTAAQWWILEDTYAPVKVPLPAGHKVTKISTDQWSVLFLMSNGTVWGAGDDKLGQLGSGRNESYNPALRRFVLPAGAVATDVYTSRFGNNDANTFVVLSNGQVYGSGRNHYGQLGIGSVSTANSYVPVKMNLPASASAKSVKTGLSTTVVLTNSGQIYTVGNNSHGQLGDGTTVSSSTPAIRPYVNDLPPIAF